MAKISTLAGSKGCRLNMKPYTDKYGNLRCRGATMCCNNPGDSCTASEHMQGFLMDDIQRMATIRKRNNERKSDLI